VEGHHPALEVLLLHKQLRDGHEAGTPEHFANELDEVGHLTGSSGPTRQLGLTPVLAQPLRLQLTVLSCT
jgi:hypothetical protein